MAEVVVGTPAIAGFTNGFGGNDLGIGLASLLIQQTLARDHADISRDVARAEGNNHVAIVEAQRAVEESVEDNAKSAELAIAGVQLEMSRLAAQAALTAATNTAALQAAIAECCCDTKALIIEKANATDALIRQLDADNTKLALQDAKNELLAIKYSTAAAAA
ncbi:MAG: hypothetical protein WC825_05965 [Gallionellaceae bacterium]